MFRQPDIHLWMKGWSPCQRGRFEVADGSSIFLDEIGELPMELQTKLLQVLEAGTFDRLGSSRTIKVDVRVISAPIATWWDPGTKSAGDRKRSHRGGAPINQLAHQRRQRRSPYFGYEFLHPAVPHT